MAAQWENPLEIAASLDPNSATVTSGETTTYDVVVDATNGSVGAYDFAVSSADPSLASISSRSPFKPGSTPGNLLAVIQALERADGPVETAEDVRWIVVGMEGSDEIPTTQEIRSALQLLAHPSIGVVTQDEDGYRATTDYENRASWSGPSGRSYNPRPKPTTDNEDICRFRHF